MNRNRIIYYALILAILAIMAFPLYDYYTVPSKDNWREAQKLTKDGRVIVIPAFNVIPYSYYSHKNETGVTYYKDLPALDGYDYVIVGPAGGYDPALWEWVQGLEVYDNVTGISIRTLTPGKTIPKDCGGQPHGYTWEEYDRCYPTGG